MAKKVTSVHARLVAAVIRTVNDLDEGRPVNVRAVARGQGMSPKTFYKWAGRYRSEGLAGLEERSRRPHRSPRRLSPVIEDAIVELRKRLAEQGLDAGAATIRWHLARGGRVRPPSEATIWRVLVRRGFVVPAPAKRPRSSWCRFEAPSPNELWQIDATKWTLADGTGVEIINVLDDHSRLCVQTLAVPTATSEGAWAAFEAGTGRYGLPLGCLSDNGLIFSGKLRGFVVFFETMLRAAGVHPITSRPYHPQTCGKVERFQQTLKKWLRAQRPQATTIAELQAQLDSFRQYYNHERPHRGIGRRTPWERFNATTAATPSHEPLPIPEQWFKATVQPHGVIPLGKAGSIGVGTAHAGGHAEVRVVDNHAVVFVDGRLVRELELSPDGGYHGTGKPPGRPRRH
jgi:transposase InsO family protein